MAELKWRTRGGTSPHGKPRVYFSCCEEDFLECFDTISAEILAISDCAIYYYGPDQNPVQDADYESNLSLMQLFVMPVTVNLLQSGNRAMDTEFPFAIQHHIPVLPLMQQGGLETQFNRRCGDLQYLDRNSKDLTAICYEEKLKKYLQSVLVGDELAQKVRAAFDAYVFLSYRKKDRKDAQELMRLIHRNDFCRDIAIWYDEFLTPGENFQDSIQSALRNSSLFLLTVTPSLLEAGNYVADCEYPEAKASAKPVIPVKMRDTDQATLETMYPEIPKCETPADMASLNQTLLNTLKQLALREKQGPEHDFFIGLAYLEGIDVEVDFVRAKQLITSAAEAGVTQAAEKLVNMYAAGQGVPRDVAAATEWKQKLILYRIRDFQANPTEENTLLLLDEQRDLADVLMRTQDITQAETFYTQIIQLAEKLIAHFPSAGASQRYAAALLCLGSIYQMRGQNDQALNNYRQAEQLLLSALKLVGVQITDTTLRLTGQADPLTTVMLSDLCTCLCYLGDVLVARGQQMQSVDDMLGGEKCYDRMLAYLQNDLLKNRYASYRHQLSVAYDRLGTMQYCRGSDEGAKKYYTLALELDEQRVKEMGQTHDNEALDAYAVSCFRLAMIDTNHPDIAYLEKARDIWTKIVQVAPELTVYAERLSEVESVLSKHRGIAPKKQSAPKTVLTATKAKTAPAKKKETPPPPPKQKTKEEVFEELLASAQTGDKNAQYQLALCYYNGDGVEKNLLTAGEWAAKSTPESGNPGYCLIVKIALELPYEALQLDSYKNAAGWAKNAARHRCYDAVDVIYQSCRKGSHKNLFRALYWKMFRAFKCKR